eukprot:9357594-Pyramimonas_sp.AAC.2
MYKTCVGAGGLTVRADRFTVKVGGFTIRAGEFTVGAGRRERCPLPCARFSPASLAYKVLPSATCDRTAGTIRRPDPTAEEAFRRYAAAAYGVSPCPVPIYRPGSQAGQVAVREVLAANSHDLAMWAAYASAEAAAGRAPRGHRSLNKTFYQ